MRYLLDPQDTQERVGHVRLTNCRGQDADDAILEVLNVQARNDRVADKTSHLLVSFRQGDEPNEAQLYHIEQHLCLTLGLQDHQRVSVVHHDTDNVHLHIAVNRIHPKKLTGHWPRWSKYLLAYGSQTLERELGMLQETEWHLKRKDMGAASSALRIYLQNAFAQPALACSTWEELHQLSATHGLSVQVRGSGLALRHRNGAIGKASNVSSDLSLKALQSRLGMYAPPELSTDAHDARAGVSAKPPTTRQNANVRPGPSVDGRANAERFTTWLRTNHVDALSQMQTWEALHAYGKEHGFVVKLRGNGLVFQDRDGTTVKASKVTRSLSKAALERRLGPYLPLTTLHEPGPRTHAPHSAKSALYARYQAEQQKRKATKSAALAELRGAQHAAFQQWREQSRARWAAIFTVTRSPLARRIWHGHTARVDQRERDQFKAHWKHERAAIHQCYRQEGWLPWLRRQAGEGCPDSLTTLRRRSQRQDARSQATGTSQVRSTTAPLRGVGSRKLYDQFITERTEHNQRAFAAQAALAREEARAHNDLRLRSQQRRAALAGMPSAQRFFGPLLARADQRDLQAHRQRFATRKRDLQVSGQLQWKPWLAQQVANRNPEALAASPTPFANVDHVTSEGTIVYSVPGGLVRDDGQALSLSSFEHPVAVEAFLHLAQHKLGPELAVLAVDGSEPFRAQLARVAGESQLPITFADPALEQARAAHRTANNGEDSHDKRDDKRDDHRYARDLRASGPNAAAARRPDPSENSHHAAANPRANHRANHQPNPGYAGSRRKAAPLDRLSSLPARGVVRDRAQPVVLLPNHAGPDLQRTAPEPGRAGDAVRRHNNAHARRLAAPRPRPPEAPRIQLKLPVGDAPTKSQTPPVQTSLKRTRKPRRRGKRR